MHFYFREQKEITSEKFKTDIANYQNRYLPWIGWGLLSWILPLTHMPGTRQQYSAEAEVKQVIEREEI